MEDIDIKRRRKINFFLWTWIGILGIQLQED